jgi:hypothetical protein
MGQDAACTLHYDGQVARGKAQLEQHELIFRGAVRLAIPLAQIKSAVASGTELTVKFGRRTAIFDLGASASRWANRITNPPSRIDKLGVKSGMTVLMAGVVHPELIDDVVARGAELLKTARAGAADIVFYGADRRQALARLDATRRALKPAGALWIIRPKGSDAITEAEVMAAGRQAGLVDVKVVSFSATHTAEKFMIPRHAR